MLQNLETRKERSCHITVGYLTASQKFMYVTKALGAAPSSTRINKSNKALTLTLS